MIKKLILSTIFLLFSASSVSAYDLGWQTGNTGSQVNILANRVRSYKVTSTTAGTVDSLTVGLNANVTTSFKALLFDSSGNLLSVSDSQSTVSAGNYTATFSTPYEISATTDYYIGIIPNASFPIKHSSTNLDVSTLTDSSNSYTTPASSTDGVFTDNIARPYIFVTVSPLPEPSISPSPTPNPSPSPPTSTSDCDMFGGAEGVQGQDGIHDDSICPIKTPDSNLTKVLDFPSFFGVLPVVYDPSVNNPSRILPIAQWVVEDPDYTDDLLGFGVSITYSSKYNVVLWLNESSNHNQGGQGGACNVLLPATSGIETKIFNFDYSDLDYCYYRNYNDYPKQSMTSPWELSLSPNPTMSLSIRYPQAPTGLSNEIQVLDYMVVFRGTDSTLSYNSPGTVVTDNFLVDGDNATFDITGDTGFTGNYQCTLKVYHTLDFNSTVATGDWNTYPVRGTFPTWDSTQILIYEDTIFQDWLGTSNFGISGTYSLTGIRVPYTQGANNFYPTTFSCTDSSGNVILNTQGADPTQSGYNSDFRLDPGSMSPISDDIWLADCAEGDIVCLIFKKIVDFVRYLVVPDQNMIASAVSNLRNSLATKTPFSYFSTLSNSDLTAPDVSGVSNNPFSSVTLMVDGESETFNTTLPTAITNSTGSIRTVLGVFLWGMFLVYLFTLYKRFQF